MTLRQPINESFFLLLHHLVANPLKHPPHVPTGSKRTEEMVVRVAVVSSMENRIFWRNASKISGVPGFRRLMVYCFVPNVIG